MFVKEPVGLCFLNREIWDRCLVWKFFPFNVFLRIADWTWAVVWLHIFCSYSHVSFQICNWRSLHSRRDAVVDFVKAGSWCLVTKVGYFVQKLACWLLITVTTLDFSFLELVVVIVVRWPFLFLFFFLDFIPQRRSLCFV